MTVLRAFVPRLLLPLVLGVGLVALVAQPARANGVPQLVKLTYLDTLSNWGPEEAEGVLEFSFAEGFLSLEAVHLPRLVGQAYEGWLVRSSTNEAISVGQFNARTDGTVQYDAQLPRITDYSLDLFVVTVQSLSEPIDEPSQLRSIGGYFSVIQALPDGESRAETGDFSPTAPGGSADDASSAAEGSADDAPSAEGPSLLPETGDTEGFLSSVRGIALITAGGLAILWAAVRTRRRTRKRGAQ